MASPLFETIAKKPTVVISVSNMKTNHFHADICASFRFPEELKIFFPVRERKQSHVTSNDLITC